MSETSLSSVSISAPSHWPVMGLGKVIVGMVEDMTTGDLGIAYSKMEEVREIGADCSDILPMGVPILESNFSACIYFLTAESVQQTIDILQDLKQELLKKEVDTNKN